MKTKKLLSALLVIFLLFGLTGCKKTEKIITKTWVTDVEYEDVEVPNEPTENVTDIKTGEQNGSPEEVSKTSSGAVKRVKKKNPDLADNQNSTSGPRVFYVSSSTGSDWNDGLSPETAFQSLAIACTKANRKGDYVLLKCGDIWRGEEIACYTGVTYASYGEGKKPLLIGSPRNYSGKGLWKKYKGNIWVCSVSVPKDVGTIVFDNGKATAIKKMKSVDELKKDFDFYHSWSENKVYLYSISDPSSRFSSIEFNYYITLIKLANGVVIDNLSMKYADYGCVGYGVANCTVKNCDFNYLGGCRHSTENETRYGNAIEFYGSCQNIVAENNYISQIYDTGFTCQYASDMTGDIIMKDILVKDNIIEYCHWSMEYYITSENSTSKYKGYLANLTISGNTFAHSGEGWSANQRSTDNSTHFETFTWKDFTKSNIVIKNNIFEGCAGTLLYIGWTDFVPEFSGNRFAQYRGSFFMNLGGKLYSFDSGIEKFIKDLDASAQILYLE